LSNALLEAMSCGIPVIVSRNGSEEVVTDGTDGFIVNWNDQSDIVNRLYQLTSNNAIRKAFGEHARKKIATQYTLNKTVKSNLLLYDDLQNYNNSLRRMTVLAKHIYCRLLAKSSRCRN